MAYLQSKLKSRFFGVVALLVMLLGATPTTVFMEWLRPPRKSDEPTSGNMTALWIGGCLLLAAVLLAIALLSPADRPFLGEVRKSWLMLLYVCLGLGCGVGIVYAMTMG